MQKKRFLKKLLKSQRLFDAELNKAHRAAELKALKQLAIANNMVINPKIKDHIEDVKRLISEYHKRGINISSLAISENKELTPDEKEVLDIIQSEILSNGGMV